MPTAKWEIVEAFGVGLRVVDAGQGVGCHDRRSGNDGAVASVTTPEMPPVMLAEVNAIAKSTNASTATTAHRGSRIADLLPEAFARFDSHHDTSI